MQTNETKIICPSCGSEDNELMSQLLIEDTLLLTYYCPHCKHSWVDSYLLVYNGYTDNTGSYDRDGMNLGWKDRAETGHDCLLSAFSQPRSFQHFLNPKCQNLTPGRFPAKPRARFFIWPYKHTQDIQNGIFLSN